MREPVRILVVIWLLAACGPPPPPPPPVDTPEAGASQDVVADGVTPHDVAGETGPTLCTTAQVTACDDNDPCTQDTCTPGGACVHAPALGAPCDDFDPCTLADVCADKGCKGKKNECDDGSPCTDNKCQVDGKCTNPPNQHYDCVPLIEVSHPPRGYRWNDPKGLLTISGKLISQKAKAVGLTLQGKSVPLGADGAFATQLQLTPGATRLDFVATDDTGGTRKRFQGVHWSAEWTKGQLPHGAIGLGAQLPLAWLPANADAWAAQWQAVLAKNAFAAPSSWSGPPVAVAWPLSSGPIAMGLPGCTGVLGLAGLPVPLALAPPLAATEVTDPGTPDLCAPHNLAADFVNDPKAMQLVLTDRAWNAALRAAWLGGAWSGNISPSVQRIPVANMEVTASAWPMTPWLLRSCTGQAGPMLDLTDLRVFLRVTPPGDPDSVLVQGNLHVSVRVQATWQWAGHVLELRLGSTLAKHADLELLGPAFVETDIQEGVIPAALTTAIPALLAQWAKFPLTELPLPTALQPGAAPLAWSWSQPLPGSGATRVTATPK